MDPIVYRALHRYHVLHARQKIRQGHDPQIVVDDLLRALKQLAGSQPSASIVAAR